MLRDICVGGAGAGAWSGVLFDGLPNVVLAADYGFLKGEGKPSALPSPSLWFLGSKHI